MTHTDDHIFEWIHEHIHDDVNRLLLKYGKDPALRYAILQIDCRKRASAKLGLTLQCPRFRFPTLLSAEQATSDALAKFHSSLIAPGSDVIDMTCGLGIDTFAMARHCRSVTACEINREIAETASANATALGLHNVNIINCDSTEFLQTPSLNADVIFADPARRGQGGKRLFALADCSPDVSVLLDRMLDIAPTVIIKASPMLDVSHTIHELRRVKRIIATGTSRECKELIAVCHRDHTNLPAYESVTLNGYDTISHFTFSETEESECSPTYSSPQRGHFIYEPYPAVMKMAPFRSLCQRYNIPKCDPDSHLYLSAQAIEGFPGKGFGVREVFPFSKQGIRDLSRITDRYDITTRNFPLTAPELAKKLKSQSSTCLRLFATTAMGRRLLILTEPLVNTDCR